MPKPHPIALALVCALSVAGCAISPQERASQPPAGWAMAHTMATGACEPLVIHCLLPEMRPSTARVRIAPDDWLTYLRGKFAEKKIAIDDSSELPSWGVKQVPTISLSPLIARL